MTLNRRRPSGCRNAAGFGYGHPTSAATAPTTDLNESSTAPSPPQFRVVEWQRRGTILTHPKLPCLSPYHTLNLTAGCPNECRYCYAQSYAHHPGWGTVAFYVNALERLREELPRLDPPPTMVYFSTASEPFLPVERIFDDLYSIHSLLLEAGSRILISTKTWIPDRFLDLFAAHPGRVHVQVGITTLDDDVRSLMEPRALPVGKRLENLERLTARGVACDARLDPLLPGITDGDESLDALFSELARRGVRHAAASFLFTRWGIPPPWKLRFERHRSDPTLPSVAEEKFQGIVAALRAMQSLYTHKVTNYCGGGTIWIPATTYRRERYRALRDLATRHGIPLHLCGCKNADVTSECCHPRPSLHAPSTPAQPTLFESVPSPGAAEVTAGNLEQHTLNPGPVRNRL